MEVEFTEAVARLSRSKPEWDGLLDGIKQYRDVEIEKIKRTLETPLCDRSELLIQSATAMTVYDKILDELESAEQYARAQEREQMALRRTQTDE